MLRGRRASGSESLMIGISFNCEGKELMFRTKGNGKEDATYHKRMILHIAEIDVGAAIVIGAMYFEWAIKRAVLALGSSPISTLNEMYRHGEDGQKLGMDKLKKLWKEELRGCVGCTSLSDYFDSKKNKRSFGRLKLTWRDLERARKLRNNIVHGGRCSPPPQNGIDYVELEVAAAEELAKLVETRTRKSIYNPIRRKCK